MVPFPFIQHKWKRNIPIEVWNRGVLSVDVTQTQRHDTPIDFKALKHTTRLRHFV
jgi:hypothetical protein